MREPIGPTTMSKDEYISESVRLWMGMHSTRIRVHKFIGVGGICLGVIFNILSRGSVAHNGSLILIVLGVLMLIVVALYPVEVRRSARKIADNPQNASYFEEFALSVDEEGFEACDSRGVTSFIPWSSLVKKRETNSATYLYVSQIGFMTFPKEYPSEHLREFVHKRIKDLPQA